MTLLDTSSVGFDLELDELFKDSAKGRAVLQNNEDKIEEFNKWSEGMVRFVKTILEEASSIILSGDIIPSNICRNVPNATES